MRNNESYRLAIESNIRKMFYHTEHTRTERKLLANGWEKEGPYWVGRSKKNDIYGLLMWGINPAELLYPNPAKIC